MRESKEGKQGKTTTTTLIAVKERIRSLFRLRDKAVKNRDIVLFSRTQLDEADTICSDVYFTYDTLTSEVLAIHPYKETDPEGLQVVFVKETYQSTKSKKTSRLFNSSRLVLHFLTETVRGWIIYKTIH